MAPYQFEHPSDAPSWCIELMKQLTMCSKGISEEIRSTNTNFEQKLDDMRSTMMKDIRAAQGKATQALDLALANEESIKQIKLQLFKSERTCNGLREENVRLQTQCDKQDSYSRRENLLIRGIKEQPGEYNNV